MKHHAPDGMSSSFHDWQSASDAFVLQLAALTRREPGASAELCRLRRIMQDCQRDALLVKANYER